MRTGITTLAVQSTAFRTTSWPALLTVIAIGCYGESLAHFGFDGTALATVAAVGISALLSSIAGFAFSAICGAILFHLRQDAVGVVQIMLVCSIANQSLSVWVLRRDIRLGTLSPFILSGAFGVPTGVWLLLHLNPVAYLQALGVVLLLYGGYMLVRSPITLRKSPIFGDVLSGFTGGLVGGFAATPGAPVSIWCGMKGWDKFASAPCSSPSSCLCKFALSLPSRRCVREAPSV